MQWGALVTKAAELDSTMMAMLNAFVQAVAEAVAVAPWSRGGRPGQAVALPFALRGLFRLFDTPPDRVARPTELPKALMEPEARDRSGGGEHATCH